MSSENLRRTPLYDEHIALGARMIAFAGFEMPVRYSGVIEEHLSVRRAAGLFDVSHMGEFLVSGPGASDFLQKMVTNDVSRIVDGQALYTVMCRHDGGIVDDLLVYRMAETDYMLVVNAANTVKDFEWLQRAAGPDEDVVDLSDNTALLALQGPHASKILASASGRSFEHIESYRFEKVDGLDLADGQEILVSATGYTGERGFELYCERSVAAGVWRKLLESGVSEGLQPAGLAARDTLRLEAGFCLYGNDIDDKTIPLEAGLGWVTKFDKGDFMGRESLLDRKRAGIQKRLVAFVMQEKGIPRRGYPILSDAGENVGVVTSGALSPVLEAGIGMGYVNNLPGLTTPGERILVDVRGRPIPAVIKKPPLFK